MKGREIFFLKGGAEKERDDESENRCGGEKGMRMSEKERRKGEGSQSRLSLS